MDIKSLLDNEVLKRDNLQELNYSKPDPLLVARDFSDPYICLLCALYGYGNAFKIVEFLQSLDFTLLKKDESTIKKNLQNYYYRFQNTDDVINSFLLVKRLKNSFDLEDLFYKGYKKEHNIIDGIDSFIAQVDTMGFEKTNGLKFLFGSRVKRDKFGTINYKQNPPYKRYNMFLRWMVRCDNLDLGYFTKIDQKDLILPLDTHTFHISQKLELLQRKSYDLQSAIEITNKLKTFDKNDPIKYDFALYRIGQEKTLDILHHLYEVHQLKL